MSSRPRVTLKLATSLDGRIATATGESRWITDELARAQVHKMRAESDCVMIGIGTALADDPELTARTSPPPARQPLRVVIDSFCRLPLGSKLAQSARENPVSLYVTANAEEMKRTQMQALHVDVHVADSMGGAGLDLAAVLGDLNSRGVNSILVEGGGTLAASLLAAGLIDVLEWMRAPIILGQEGIPAIGALALDSLAKAPRFKRVNLTSLGDDVWETYEV